MRWVNRTLLVVPLVVLAGCVYGGEDRVAQMSEAEAEVAEAADASRCDDSGFTITETDADGEVEREYPIYNCTIDGELRCVSFDREFFEDETEWARNDWDADDSEFPECIGEES